MNNYCSSHEKIQLEIIKKRLLEALNQFDKNNEIYWVNVRLEKVLIEYLLNIVNENNFQ